MFNLKRVTVGSLFVFVLTGAAMAQENRAPAERPREAVASGPLVTAAATGERVRFTAPSNVVRMQLQVISEMGQILFEVSSKGNVLDWTLQDGSGQRLHGAYLTVVTVKSLSGRVSERIGSVSVAAQQVELSVVEATGLTAAQQQAVGPIEGHASLTILKSDEGEPVTVLANNGSEGQIIRERGALSFRLGDFYAGEDSEQMRLTEAGNLGIGTDKPAAKLDVAGDVHATGTIRASQGIEFTDGTVQTTGLSGRKDKDGNLMPNVSGTGTQNRLAKWTDNAGTLGNSNVTEAASGKLGIGTVNPNYEITLFGNDVGLQLISPGTGVTANDGFRFGIDSTNKAFLWNVEATDMYFGTTATERMRIKATGNVGIGTNNPTQKLDVAGNINTSTQYHIGGARMLSASGTHNLFVGAGAGNANTTGTDNSFFGYNSGTSNIGGFGNAFFGANAGTNSTTHNNSFFGANAGTSNTSGHGNSFFGYAAGANNTIGVFNAFFGAGAGFLSSTGSGNSLFGSTAGDSVTTGSDNSFFGRAAGASSTSADQNSFFGSLAGVANIASNNSFFGYAAGNSNTHASFNSFFGWTAGEANTTGLANSIFGARAGKNNTTGDNNSFFGSSAGDSNTTASYNSFLGASAGSTNTTGDVNSFFGWSAGSSNTTGANNSFFGGGSGFWNKNGDQNSFFGRSAGGLNNIGNNNSFFGASAGNSNTTGSNNTIIGIDADVGAGDLSFATAIGAEAIVSTSNSIVLGRPDGSDAVRIPGAVLIDGSLVVGTMGAAGSDQLCLNSSNRLAGCSSSLRYKTQVQSFLGGLDIVRRLRPISFTWKDGSRRDLGLGAEEVARVEPLLTFRNKQGEIEGVRYNQLSAVLVNAVNEQQQTITELRRQNAVLEARLREQAARLDALECAASKGKLR